MAKADDMAECQKRCAIVTGKPLEQGVTGTPQMVEPLARDALADVQSENDVDRELFKADEIDFLQDSFVSDLEVLGRKAAYDLTTIRDEYVHTNRVHARSKRWLLRADRGSAQDDGDPRSDLHGDSAWTI
jgi:hypothetical protein